MTSDEKTRRRTAPKEDTAAGCPAAGAAGGCAADTDLTADACAECPADDDL
ncbi:MAG: hypothetical protein IMW93_01550 [Thermoanaerobacteraceae bacterium]|uniref:hypothetical protein n=1 Tax=Desulfofundulus thermobenzoicus TaxID=29376 RepID=UPI00128EE59A|nr:hypothetical protein [Desulfofundulus thermobenzoicus]MBE3587240.1 hypothetical protein [Thermoanaerobacteraceae bacterium]HHW42315.1 hypothetical protein [Desulfotomaculum sp.]